MALTRDKKASVISELEQLFAGSKMTVVAKYQGMTVKSIQELRSEARKSGSTIKVVKNRLVVKALQNSDALKSTDTSGLKDMLMYVFSPEEETVGAQTLLAYSKKDTNVQFVGAITADGQFMSAEDVKALASLPSKPQLIAGIVNLLESPARGVLGQLTGNLHGMLDAIAAKAAN